LSDFMSEEQDHQHGSILVEGVAPYIENILLTSYQRGCWARPHVQVSLCTQLPREEPADARKAVFLRPTITIAGVEVRSQFANEDKLRCQLSP
jgi:hypothetical protein